MKLLAIAGLVFLLGCTQNSNLSGFEDARFVSRSSIAGLAQSRYEFENSTTYKLVKVYDLSGEEQERYVTGWVRSFESIFSESEAPYPGAVTKKIVCPKEFLPKELTVEGGHVYEVFANSRKRFGACSQDLVAYYCVSGVLSCDKLYEFKYCRTSAGETYDFSSFAQKLTCPEVLG